MSYRVADEHLNKFDTLHGGMGATLVDAITTVAIMGTDKNQRPGVSVNLNVTLVYLHLNLFWYVSFASVFYADQFQVLVSG